MDKKMNVSISESLVRVSRIKFLSTIAISFLAIVIVQTLRTDTGPEFWDKFLVAASVLCGLQIFFIKNKVDRFPSPLISALALLAFIFGIAFIEDHDAINGVNINEIFWMGFGSHILGLVLLLVPWVYVIYLQGTTKKISRIMIRLLALAVILLLIPAAWQGGASLIEPDSPEYVINELLAVPAGNLPYVDFIPQYGILYTWLVVPFTNFFSPDELVTLGLYLMSAGAILAVLLGVWIVHKATNKRSLALSVLLVVPLTSVTQFPGRESLSGSIFSAPTQVPIRLLIPVIAALVLLAGILKSNKVLITATFVLLGVNLWINTDFGAAALLSALLLIFLASREMRFIIIVVAAALLGWFTYPVLSLSQDLKIDSFATFIRQFGGGFGSEPIQSPGPVLIVLPLIVALFFASNYPLYQERFRKIPIQEELRLAVLTASFFSTWSLIGFAYYLNRSYASGQMQILFLPLSIAMASYFYYILPRKTEDLPWSGRSFFKRETWKGKALKKNLAHLPIAMAMSLPLVTIVAFPNPVIEFERLTNAPVENRWPPLKNQQFLSELPSILTSYDKNSVAYFGSSGNYVSMNYGLESVNIFNSPFDLFMSQAMVNLGCEPVVASGAKYLILNDSGLVVARNFSNSELCGVYRFDPSLGSRVVVRK